MRQEVSEDEGNPDKDIIDILPGANWCGTCYRERQKQNNRDTLVGDVGGPPKRDGTNQTGQTFGDFGSQTYRRLQPPSPFILIQKKNSNIKNESSFPLEMNVFLVY
jgi:hypothetical protein